MREKEDRRVKYTKALLKDALLELMQTQHISKISVMALCDMADVHRSTFYAHYTDQYDLLRQIMNEALANIAKYLEEKDYGGGVPVSVERLDEILKYVKSDVEVFKAILSENSDITVQREVMSLFDVVSFPGGLVLDETKKEYIRLFSLYGCISVLSQWMQDGMEMPTGELARFLMKLLNEGIKSL